MMSRVGSLKKHAMRAKGRGAAFVFADVYLKSFYKRAQNKKSLNFSTPFQVGTSEGDTGSDVRASSRCLRAPPPGSPHGIQLDVALSVALRNDDGARSSVLSPPGVYLVRP